MTEPLPLPLSHLTNLARLGNAGDTVSFAADDAQRADIARWSEILSVEDFQVTVLLRKLAPTRFGLEYRLLADITQACVVTLEPVPAHMERSFTRELLFSAPVRRKPVDVPAISESELVLTGEEEEGPEQIDSLHYDLASPVLEEYVLALEPYPRRPGVAFTPETGGQDRPESPFAVLKGLKQGL